MYEAKFPEVDQVVMVQVKSIAEMGAYVQLLEYNNIEGMILLSELTRRRIRSVSKLIKVGRIEPVMVLRVDKEKGYIDLSKRRVSPEDVAACEEKYNKSKMVHSIVRHTAETTPATLGDLYEHMAWPLAAKYGHCFEAFKHMVGDPDKVLDELKKPDGTPAVDATVKNALVKDIRRRMTPQPLKIRADVELTCFAYDGVLHIKEAMRAAEAVSTEECKVKISLVASPLCRIGADFGQGLRREAGGSGGGGVRGGDREARREDRRQGGCARGVRARRPSPRGEDGEAAEGEGGKLGFGLGGRDHGRRGHREADRAHRLIVQMFIRT